jgi:EAL domain-containing protein (putative c-di-GMP-specific phosphodiesterase class I)
MTDASSRAVVASMLELAGTLGLDSVADGVPTPEAAVALAAMGCTAGQGRRWTSPLSAERVTEWLAGPGAGRVEGQAA